MDYCNIIVFLLFCTFVNGYSVLTNNKDIDRRDTSANHIEEKSGLDNFAHIEWLDDAIGSNMENATSFPLDIFHDPRWHDSPSYNGTMDFTFTESASFSVSGQFKSEMFIHSYPSPLHFDLPKRETFEKWTHYTLLSQNGCLLLYKNCELLKNWTRIENQTFRAVVKGDGFTQFKKHLYKYKKWTKATTNDKESSNLLINSYGKSTLTLRVNMCQSCYLEIKAPNGSVIHVDNDDLADSCSRWHILNLTNNNGNNTFTFYRGKKLQGGNTGYWKVDTIISRRHQNEETWSFYKEVLLPVILLVILISAVVLCNASRKYFGAVQERDSSLFVECNENNDKLIDNNNSVFVNY